MFAGTLAKLECDEEKISLRHFVRVRAEREVKRKLRRKEFGLLH
jgi:hypothetical protein